MSLRKTKKEPTLELESEEESNESSEEIGSFGGNLELEDEAELATPPLEKKKRMETRALDKKKPASVFKTPVSQKRPVKIPKKGESSQKKPRPK